MNYEEEYEDWKSYFLEVFGRSPKDEEKVVFNADWSNDIETLSIISLDQRILEEA